MTPKEELQRHLSQCLKNIEGSLSFLNGVRTQDGKSFHRRNVRNMEQSELDSIRTEAENIHGRLKQSIELLEKL